MRLSRGAGAHGLAAMREESLVASGAGDPLRLLRPLLSISREAVTQWLRAAGQDFIDDPSNDDPAYERVRVRALLAALAEQDLLTADALGEAARKAAGAADRLAAQEDDLFNALGGCLYGWGGICVERWRDDAPGAAGLARRIIYAAGGGEFQPAADAAAEAVSHALTTGAGTLGGALIKLWKGRLWFLREPAALTGRAGTPPMGPLPLQDALLWDRRFAISAPDGGDFDIAPMGAAAGAFLGPRAGLFIGPEEGLAALPGVCRGGVLIGAPALPFMTDRPVSAKSLIGERLRGRIVRFS